MRQRSLPWQRHFEKVLSYLRELCLQLLSTVKFAMTQITIIDLFSKYLVYIDELSRKSFDFEIIFIVKIQRR